MENLRYTTFQGIEVELNVTDMSYVHNHYEVQNTADYLRDTYMDWSERKIQDIAAETRRLMDKYMSSEEEAISNAIRNYNEREYAADDEIYDELEEPEDIELWE